MARVKRVRLAAAQVITATTQTAAKEIGLGKTRLTTTSKIASIGGTTPSYTVVVEGSYNGTDWVAINSHTAQTANGYSKIEASESQGTTAISIPPLLRANITVSGTTPTAAVTVDCYAE
jgi:hypothetical protein